MAFITKCVSLTQERRGEIPTVETINLRQGDVTREALKVASELRISVDGEGKVHAFVAITAVLRKCVVLLGPEALGEMDDLDKHRAELEITNPELKHMGMTSKAKQLTEKLVEQQGGEQQGLDQSMATVLIQRRFRHIVEEKRAAKADLAEGLNEEEREARKSVRMKKRATENAIGMVWGFGDEPVPKDSKQEVDGDEPGDLVQGSEDKKNAFGGLEIMSKPDTFGALGSRPNSRADGFNSANSSKPDGFSPERPRSHGHSVRIDGVQSFDG